MYFTEVEESSSKGGKHGIGSTSIKTKMQRRVKRGQHMDTQKHFQPHTCTCGGCELRGWEDREKALGVRQKWDYTTQ